MFAFKDLPDGSLSKLRVPLYNYISLEKSFKTTEFERNSVVLRALVEDAMTASRRLLSNSLSCYVVCPL